jgi:hypothetical protein
MCGNLESFDRQLFECCIIMVSILLKQYRNKMIDITDFKCHTANKIRYIFENMECETNIEKKKNIENLLKECNTINSYN